MGSNSRELKRQRRDVGLTARRAMSPVERERAAEALAHHLLALPALTRARSVAAYLSLPDEPPTGPAISGLLERGTVVWVPVVDSATTLRWAQVSPDEPTRVGRFGIAEPTGPTRGPDALGELDAVIVPALQVDHHGHRLGRGGGYYDRALAGHAGLLIALLHDGELVTHVPHEPHDLVVDLVVCPSGVFRPEPA